MAIDARFLAGPIPPVGELDADLPPRRGQLSPSQEDVQRSPRADALNPQEMDGPDDLTIDEAFITRARIPPVVWPSSDSDAPDYAHLLPEGREPAVGGRRFELGAEELELLVRANAFEPEGHDDRFVFALRGARLVEGDHAETVPRIRLEDVRPDHRDFRCVIGIYDRRARTLSAFKASTVPNVKYMTNYFQWKNNLGGNSSIAANMLPTGCYVFRVGAHGGGKIYPALRLTDPDKLGEDGAATVVRTFNDLTYAADDLWDRCTPYDNVHCAYAYDSFSSAGCLTICGPDGAGPWGRFQSVLKTMGTNARLDVVLLTGREASIAAYLVETSRQGDDELVAKLLGRLRTGSMGEAVARLQQRLGVSPTGYFGGSTKKALTDFQRRNGLRADGIYSAALEARLAWDVMSAPVTVSAPPAAEEPMPTVQPDPVMAPDALEQLETLETPLEAALVPLTARPAEEVELASVARAVAAERAEAAVRPLRGAGATAEPATGATDTRLVMTAQALERFAPRALPQYRDALIAGNEVLALYGISESRLRLCHFLAQIATQCGRLTVLEENLNCTSAMRVRTIWPTRFPTVASAVTYLGHPQRLAERVYGDRFENRPGDGWRFRGRGFVMLTGRSNYREMGKKLGIPLEDDPDLAGHPDHALTIACETWMSRQLAGERETNRLAELNKLEALTYRMTGGYFDLDERRNAFAEAWATWGQGDRPDRVLEGGVLERGDRAGRVAELNARLKFLGLFEGITDEPPQHVFTLSTYKALQRLQGGEGIALSGVAGADTWTALDDAIDQKLQGPLARPGAKSGWPPGARHPTDAAGLRLAEVRGWSAALAFFALLFVALYMFASIEPGRLGVSVYWMPLLFAGLVFVGGLAMWLAARLPSARTRRRSVFAPMGGGRRSHPGSGGFVVGEEEPVRQGLNLDAAVK